MWALKNPRARNRMQIFKVRNRVLLSRRLSQVANSCGSDLFYALPGQCGDNRGGEKSGEDRWIREPRGGKKRRSRGPTRGSVALFTIARVSLSLSISPPVTGGAVLEDSFFLRENLIRSTVGPAHTRFEITFTRGPAFFFPAPRGHGAVIKARLVSGSAFLPVRPVCSGPTPSGYLSPASGWILFPFHISLVSSFF